MLENTHFPASVIDAFLNTGHLCYLRHADPAMSFGRPVQRSAATVRCT